MLAATWDCGSIAFQLHDPIIMGICNVTPDSFSDGGAHATCDEALAHARRLLDAGADIIDVGGESTRPEAGEVPCDLELDRVLPVVRSLAAEGVAVSIDTRHASVASACVEAGACIINDVSGFRDRAMREVAASCDAGLVVMHMQGDPATMQIAPDYEDVALDVRCELERMAQRLQAEGIAHDRICIDPGIGFGKNLMHNQALVEATARFANLGYPLMAAVSRKSFIGSMSCVDEPVMRDAASALCAAFMVAQGARIVRVHDVLETRRAFESSRTAVIGMGSNLGDACAHLDGALDRLRKNPAIWVCSVSEYVTSEPAYFEAQAPFVNAVAIVQTTLDPRALLQALHDIENAHGRVRTIPNGPRSLDLDIVDYEGVVLDDADLVLPHPRTLERDFVVTPLLSISPGHRLADGTDVTRDAVSVGKVTGLRS